MPDGHGLIEVDCPTGKEYGSYVVITCHYHLVKFPNLTTYGGGASVIEPKFMSDGVKAECRHEFTQAIGAWICLLLRGSDTPKTLPLPSIADGH